MTESAVVHIDGNPIWLCVSVGEVVSQQKWSETSVYSSGGSVSGDGRYASAPTVSSVVREKHEFWIKEADGKEVCVALTDGGFQVRDGQKVWVAWGGKKGQERGRYLFAHNITSGDDAVLVGNWTEWLYKSKIVSKPILYRLLTIWLPIVLGVLGVFLLPMNILGDFHSISESLYALLSFFVDCTRGKSCMHDFLGKGQVIGFEDSIQMLMVIGSGFLVAWIPSFSVTNIVGYVFFLHWRDKFLTALYRKRIAEHCRKMVLMAMSDAKKV